MKYSNVVLGGLVAFAGAAVAMPTQNQVKEVEPLVLELMKDDQSALKSGKKTRVEVAESAIALADKADSEAAKLLLLKGAFNLYVRAGEFDKANETLQAMQAAIPDISPACMAGIIEKSLRSVSRKNGGQLYRLLDETKIRMRYTSETKKMEKALKENPDDRKLRTKLAEHYAYLGEWDKALENFAETDAKTRAIAKSEQGGNAGEKAADFWWSYPTGKADELVKAFRIHAAKLYESALADSKITGLNKVQAERRIAETKEYGEQNLFAASAEKDGLYCVIDLSGGPNAKKCPVTYLNDVPKNGWSDEYKTKKLVLRKIKAGKEPLGRYTIKEDFYIGVFEITQRQYEQALGTNPSKNKGDMKSVDSVSFEMIRGKNKGLMWPKSDAVDDESFVSALRQRSGLKIDLPTEAQWEYACRAGTKSKFNDGGNSESDLIKIGRCIHNGGKTDHQAVVGSYIPNKWGLYDMHGNVWELCLDKSEDCLWTTKWERPTSDNPNYYMGSCSGKYRIRRGGSWNGGMQGDCCTAGLRCTVMPNEQSDDVGFRLSIQPPFVSPKSDEKR